MHVKTNLSPADSIERATPFEDRILGVLRQMGQYEAAAAFTQDCRAFSASFDAVSSRGGLLIHLCEE